MIRERSKLKGENKDYYELGGPRSSAVPDWIAPEDEESGGLYVDLTKNVEAFTGYQGQRVWEMIYQENCFRSDKCMEEKLLYKAVSGMHASVSSHLSEYHIDFAKKKKTGEMKPNVRMYFDKVGKYPERIKNLYFAYTLMLRAFKIAAEAIVSFDVSTTDFASDMKAKQLLKEASDVSKMYPDIIFDETSLFKEESKVSFWGLKSRRCSSTSLRATSTIFHGS